ncbi:MAG: hypothetical protein ucyna2_00185 [Candidatus Atelocyanobacterium thalassa isolate SIO64986]|uniref:Uncharacterized protein n=1 Tax=Candidatus Atelocyanobacterium thalassa isolate SIO64986 TaxID=1527444 RepID=A0A086CIV7_9CHRO|nr:MAG: hypothetical protein ucyna2_00185 [Candidatus Atelocyanobacterium thalassa isolate SIO64986]
MNLSCFLASRYSLVFLTLELLLIDGKYQDYVALQNYLFKVL